MLHTSKITPTEDSLAKGNEPRNFSAELREKMKLALNECRGDEAAAVALALDRIQGDREFLLYLLGDKLWDAVRTVRAEVRASLERHAAYTIRDGAADHAGARTANHIRYYDWPLPGGKRIGQASLEDIRAAKGWHDERIKGDTRRRNFYAEIERRIAQAKAKFLRNAIDEAALGKLIKEYGVEN